jgi:ABC-2 type transport system ATP-binding protein
MSRNPVTEAIATEGLTKVYQRHIGRPAQRSLDALTLTVGEHEVFGFLGQNGAGKTTTIKIICSLLRATAGEARVFGEDVRRRRTRARIGYLPENPYFYEYLTPRETVEFYGRLHGMKAPERSRTWARLAELLDLGSIGNQRVRGFSKGMRQRLGFAVALVGDPEVLVLDEPMSGLDPLGRHRIRQLILQLRDEKRTIFFSSHILGDVEQVCDQVGILVRGKLVRQGRIDELLREHIQQVEVIVGGLDDARARALANGSVRVRESEAGHHFVLDSPDRADRFVRDAHQQGGRLVEFNPIRESLEDYFVRQQEGAPS